MILLKQFPLIFSHPTREYVYMPEASLNCIVCLRKGREIPWCPAALIRSGRLEEYPRGSDTIVEAKLLAQHQARRRTGCSQFQMKQCNSTQQPRAGFSSLDVYMFYLREVQQQHTSLKCGVHRYEGWSVGKEFAFLWIPAIKPHLTFPHFLN